MPPSVVSEGSPVTCALKQRISCPFVTEAFDVYLTRLRQDKEWGGHDSLQALAEVLHVEFVVWEPLHPRLSIRPRMPQYVRHLGYNGRNHWVQWELNLPPHQRPLTRPLWHRAPPRTTI